MFADEKSQNQVRSFNKAALGFIFLYLKYGGCSLLDTR